MRDVLFHEYTYTIRDICTFVQTGLLRLAKRKQPPHHTKQLEMRYLESLLAEIPPPILYGCKNLAGQIAIVFGLEFLQAVCAFVRDTIALDALILLPNLSAKKFSDLTSTYQDIFLNTKITIYALDSACPEDKKYDVFSVLCDLPEQEIRRRLHTGPYEEFVAFVQKRIKQEATICTTCAYMLFADTFYTGKSLRELQSYAMIAINSMHDHTVPEYKRYFSEDGTLLLASKEQLAQYIFRGTKRYCKFFSNDKIEKALLYRRCAFAPAANNQFFPVLCACFAKLSGAEYRYLVEKKKDFLQEYCKLDSTYTELEFYFAVKAYLKNFLR